ncbi:MAG: peptidoglycan editing factor PgeF [Campylobacterota bacterium]|nr:peptidoglycan editing factor PgeF [Campylobacterota bacterium]
MKIIQSNLLNSFCNITHAFTTKEFGNLAFHVNDDIRAVKQNHKNLSKTLNYSKITLVHMKQVHSNIIHIVDEYDNFNNPPTCDALITDRIETPLMVMAADCSPILFYDKKNRVIAVAHAGRKGAFSNIVKNVINSFQNNYNSDAKNIYVSIGANIGSCCYRVGDEIYRETKKLNLDYAIKKKSKNYYLDIRKILKKQLLSSGIIEKNIEISNDCTCCISDKYFSYRADSLTGRFCGVILLKKI